MTTSHEIYLNKFFKFECYTIEKICNKNNSELRIKVFKLSKKNEKERAREKGRERERDREFHVLKIQARTFQKLQNLILTVSHLTFNTSRYVNFKSLRLIEPKDYVFLFIIIYNCRQKYWHYADATINLYFKENRVYIFEENDNKMLIFIKSCIL